MISEQFTVKLRITSVTSPDKNGQSSTKIKASMWNFVTNYREHRPQKSVFDVYLADTPRFEGTFAWFL